LHLGGAREQGGGRVAVGVVGSLAAVSPQIGPGPKAQVINILLRSDKSRAKISLLRYERFFPSIVRLRSSMAAPIPPPKQNDLAGPPGAQNPQFSQYTHAAGSNAMPASPHATYNGSIQHHPTQFGYINHDPNPPPWTPSYNAQPVRTIASVSSRKIIDIRPTTYSNSRS
jgi:hypothetical protein